MPNRDYKDLWKYWDQNKNDKKPEQLSAGSHYKAYWVCPHGHSWQSSIRDQVKKKSICNVCKQQEKFSLNNLAQSYPWLLTEWDSEKNSHLQPHLLSPGSHKKVWWKCKQGHSWQTPLYSRTKKDPSGCPECVQQSIIDNNNLCNTQSKWLLHRWDYNKNVLSPEYYSAGSTKKVYWKCSNGHSWQEAINVMAKRVPSYCPSCSKDRSIKKNNKKENRPLAKDNLLWSQWDGDKNPGLDPQTLYCTNHKKVYWRCDKGHSWQAYINRRFHEKTGCPVCAKNKYAISNNLSESYPQLAKEWDGDKNDKHVSEYSASSAYKAFWKCSNGHSWQAAIYSRTKLKNPSNCPKCSCSGISKLEKEVVEYLTELQVVVEENKRDLPGISEIDIYVPSHNLAIEFNGLYWHSEANGKGRNYHFQKYKACKQQHIQLIQIWEDEWIAKQEIVQSMLAHKLGMSDKEKIYARKTVVKQINQQQSFLFLEKYHIQGYGKGFLHYGLFDKQNGELVAVSVFKHRSNGDAELVRYATNQNVVGGMSKLIKAFQRNNSKYRVLVTFADHQVSDGGLYEKLGFEQSKVLKPDYKYLVGRQRVHKFNYRLKRFKDDPQLIWEEGKSERELALINHIPRVWDSGKTRYHLKLD